ncbi:hypothetical protein YC2023_093556 [Brassica napus]
MEEVLGVYEKIREDIKSKLQEKRIDRKRMFVLDAKFWKAYVKKNNNGLTLPYLVDKDVKNRNNGLTPPLWLTKI